MAIGKDRDGFTLKSSAPRTTCSLAPVPGIDLRASDERLPGPEIELPFVDWNYRAFPMWQGQARNRTPQTPVARLGPENTKDLGGIALLLRLVPLPCVSRSQP